MHGPMVEFLTTDPMVVGSNHGCSEIGLYVFHNPQWARVLVNLLPSKQSLRMTWLIVRTCS